MCTADALGGTDCAMLVGVLSTQGSHERTLFAPGAESLSGDPFRDGASLVTPGHGDEVPRGVAVCGCLAHRRRAVQLPDVPDRSRRARGARGLLVGEGGLLERAPEGRGLRERVPALRRRVRRVRLVETHAIEGRDDRALDPGGAGPRQRYGSDDGWPRGRVGREGDQGAGGTEGSAQRMGDTTENGARALEARAMRGEARGERGGQMEEAS